MKTNEFDGRRLDHKTREKLRIRAVKLVEQGQSPEQVVKALGFHRSCIYEWLAKYREGGTKALKTKTISGRPKKLKGHEFPKIKAMAREAAADIYFGDEASVRSDYHSGTTWALKGQTPVVQSTGARFSVNMISAISQRGLLRFMTIDGKLTAGKFIDFLKRLIHNAEKPIFLIVDGHPTHKAGKVRKFVESTEGRLRLFILPPYSPELNPSELVWNNLKNHRVGRKTITGPDDLKHKVMSGLRSLQKMPAKIIGFFHEKHTRYAMADMSGA